VKIKNWQSLNPATRLMPLLFFIEYSMQN